MQVLAAVPYYDLLTLIIAYKKTSFLNIENIFRFDIILVNEIKNLSVPKIYTS